MPGFWTRTARTSLLEDRSDSSLPLYRKLLLVAAMTGLEMILTFEFLYEMPLLQMFGVPITFISLYPIVTGPATISAMAILGRLSDKGTDPRKSKVIVVILVSAMNVLGVCLVIGSNLILMSNNSRGMMTNVSDTYLHYKDLSNCTGFDKMKGIVNNSIDDMFRLSASSSFSRDFLAMDVNSSTERNSSQQEGLQEKEGSPPLVTAILGILGFGLLDMGCDVSMGSTRACVLACSSSSDHTVLLILALVLAAVGGCLNNALGMVDLSQVLDFGPGHEKLTAQTTVQLMLCGLMVIITATSTVISALININTTDITYQPLENDNDVNENTPQYGSFNAERRIRVADMQTETPGEETSLCNNGPSTSIKSPENEGITLAEDRDVISRSAFNLKPEAPPQDDTLVCKSGTDPSAITGFSVVFANIGKKTSDLAKVLSWEYWKRDRHKFNFVLAFITGYLGLSSLSCYIRYVSDFLGKVVMGGDSTAAHDSAEFKAYRDGVSLGATGLLIVFCCCLMINIAQSKLHNTWGMKMRFCVPNIVMSGAILSLVLSKHVAAYYTCCVAYSLQRSALLSVPYIIAKDYAHEQEKRGECATGKTIGIMACITPLNLCTTFVISGPMITLTGYTGTPLLLSSFWAGLSPLLFFLLYKPSPLSGDTCNS